MRYHLASAGLGRRFFGEMLEAGSHQAALEMILSGAVAGAAIDSSVLEAELRARPELVDAIRVVLTWDPARRRPGSCRRAWPLGCEPA